MHDYCLALRRSAIIIIYVLMIFFYCSDEISSLSCGTACIIGATGRAVCVHNTSLVVCLVHSGSNNINNHISGAENFCCGAHQAQKREIQVS